MQNMFRSARWSESMPLFVCACVSWSMIIYLEKNIEASEWDF